MESVSRNDPCPCNSGKAYKDCHMRSFFTPDEGFEVKVGEGNVAPTTHMESSDGVNWVERPGRLTLRAYYDYVIYEDIDNILQPIIAAVPQNRQIVGLRLKRLRHKVYGVRYHLENFKHAEDAEIAALLTKHVGTDHDAVQNDPKIIYEVEGLLFQLKSTLDVLAQVIAIIYRLGTIITYSEDGEVLVRLLRHNSSKDQRMKAVQLALVLEGQRSWVSDVIDMRDEVTHLSDLEGFSSFIHHAWEGGTTTKISYPSMPNGQRARTYMEGTYQKLVSMLSNVSPYLISELHPSETQNP